ncbi:hypothetical protein GCM10012284_42790 [Mangrovihabitans endophyticus]|uniref:Uncharacterized protein n=1 Tax=Mangrovihabitans endophyticus TaxID=1751298 RepID=A0A8J3C3F8_9ACTN|nr:hypothetical protein GCM10012284_42790 [Mangrovihabitans endophyticus]
MGGLSCLGIPNIPLALAPTGLEGSSRELLSRIPSVVDEMWRDGPFAVGPLPLGLWGPTMSVRRRIARREPH